MYLSKISAGCSIEWNWLGESYLPFAMVRYLSLYDATTAGGKPLSAVKGLFPKLAPSELKTLSDVLLSIGGDNS